MKKKKRPFLISILLWIIKIHVYLWILILALCCIYSLVNPPITPIMLHRYLIRQYDWHKRYFCPLTAIPTSTQKMVLNLEDPNFYKHWGFEWQSIRTAWKKNTRAGKIKFGASTITNQLARTLFLTTHRNYFRKYLEAQITIILELSMSKKRILELYLNYLECGKGIYGLDSASRYYYSHSIRQLTTDESMRLVSILTNPIKYTPASFYRSRSAMQRYNMLLRYSNGI